MIWVYTVTESNELQARDASSLQELQSLSKEVDWLWIDFMEPDDKELEVVAGLLEAAKIVSDFKERKVFPRPERIDDYLLFSVPLAVYESRLEAFSIYVFVKEKMFLTLRSRHFSKSVKNSLKTFEDCVGKVCAGVTNSSFILSRLFHEISNENLDVVIALRENIDKIEERTLAKPWDKGISRSVFGIKREISALERILWAQRELILSIREGVVLEIKTSERIVATLSHAVNNISRELSLLDSDNNALDSILRLQDLGMIHKVERNLIYLTLMALIVSALLILLEIDIINLLSR
ncbi:MAG: CorA family divalent cation transporter [Candidatus Bathyarchaeota archaeon]|nr:CorA family divalent cation transporter [Candidatus Bathyarchaeota archaeon]MDH5494120.1 CorA family divalent cation transporter [Candidatus Bathyarchaeota archaeon]